MVNERGKIILRLAIEEHFQKDVILNRLAEFEAMYPGVSVRLINDAYAPHGLMLDKHFNDDIYQGARDFITAADIFYMNTGDTYPMLARAGYLLNLLPLVQQDENNLASEFPPAIWQSFQWDSGLWALPYTFRGGLLVYNSVAFDQAGLTYPDANWTLHDLSTALRAFQRSLPSYQKRQRLISHEMMYLFASLLGEYLADDSAHPSQPRLNTPKIAQLTTAWSELWADELFDNGLVDTEAPIFIGMPAPLNSKVGSERTWTLLPGGHTYLECTSFILSSATGHPDLAYALGKFLTTAVPEHLLSARTSVLAKRGLINESQQILDNTLRNAIPFAQVRFAPYLWDSGLWYQKIERPIDHDLEQLQKLAEEALVFAGRKRAKPLVLQALEPPPPDLPEGKFWLRFAQGYPPVWWRQDAWEQLIEQFTATDREVGHLTADYVHWTEDHECILRTDQPPVSRNFDDFLPLDEFLRADPTFDEADLITGVLQQYRHEGKTYGLPIAVLPGVIQLNSEVFQKAGVPVPDSSHGWTVDEFASALAQLKASNILNPDTAPFHPGMITGTISPGTALLMLVAAYGGLPIDYRTVPPQLRFHLQPERDAIRKVLNLARQTLIDYSLALVQNESTGGGLSPDAWAVLPVDLATFLSRYLEEPNRQVNPIDTDYMRRWRVVSFPVGTYKPIYYTLIGGYIRKNAKHPEACYRWLRTIAHQPDLFGAMPVCHSMFNMYGESVQPFFEHFAKQIDDLESAIWRGTFPWDINYQFENLLFRAFDAYVLENKDLDESLNLTIERTNKFIQCLQDIKEVRTHDEYQKAIQECYKNVDPDYRV
jgi:ABC-type glycerol-3-phosphate transport system substrate-binding protein